MTTLRPRLSMQIPEELAEDLDNIFQGTRLKTAVTVNLLESFVFSYQSLPKKKQAMFVDLMAYNMIQINFILKNSKEK